MYERLGAEGPLHDECSKLLILALTQIAAISDYKISLKNCGRWAEATVLQEQ